MAQPVSHHRMKGQPLVVLGAVLAGWLGGRVATWDPVSVFTHGFTPIVSAFRDSGGQGPGDYGHGGTGKQASQVVGPEVRADLVASGDDAARSPEPAGPLGEEDMVRLLRLLLDLHDQRGSSGVTSPALARDVGRAVQLAQGPGRSFVPLSGREVQEGQGSDFYLAPGASGFAREQVAARGFLSELPAPTRGAVARRGKGEAGPADEGVPRETRIRRWSADGWAMLRSGQGGGLASSAFPAAYGASQAGAVLRFRPRPQSRFRPDLYMRTTSSLGDVREATAALGVSLRPIPSVPVVAALEGRLTSGLGGNRIQPVAMAITQLPTVELPAGFRGEAYGQAGYVAGGYATPFADGQVRIDREMLELGRIEARLGAGAWGGGQKGVSRLDLGPSAVVSMPLGERYFGRVAIDWRFRVQGNAEPGSGPAVTLSAGF